MRKGTLLLFMFLVLSLAALATEGRPETSPLPAELVERLLGGELSPADLVIGAIPEPLESMVPIPPAARVDATVDRLGRKMILLTMAGPSEAARDSLASTLKEGGWTEARDPQMARGGFILDVDRSHGLCRDDQQLMIHVGRERAGEVPATIYIQDNPGSICRSPEPRPLHPEEIELPMLFPPPGVAPRGTSSGGGMGYNSSGAKFETRGPLGQLVQHYHAQILEQGWARAESLESGGVTLSVYDRTDEEGKDWVLVLNAVGTSTRTRHFQITVYPRE